MSDRAEAHDGLYLTCPCPPRHDHGRIDVQRERHGWDLDVGSSWDSDGCRDVDVRRDVGARWFGDVPREVSRQLPELGELEEDGISC
jgi:hypothetical protein